MRLSKIIVVVAILTGAARPDTRSVQPEVPSKPTRDPEGDQGGSVKGTVANDTHIGFPTGSRTGTVRLAGGWCRYPMDRPNKASTPAAVSLIPVAEVEPNDTPGSAQVIPLGSATGQDRDLDIAGNVSPASDLDYYRFTAAKGDIIGMAALGGGGLDTLLTVTGPAGTPLIENDDDPGITAIVPIGSPFPGGVQGSDSALTWVVPGTGDYLVRAASVNGGSSGPYTLKIRSRRGALEQQPVGATQIIFLDFDGGSINAETLFGIGNNPANLSPLSTFLPRWGLTTADEPAVIDAIMAVIRENFDDLRLRALNGDRDSDLIDGHFDVQWLNSRDDADVFGSLFVSRVLVGGSVSELGISTIGIAESLDPGNFGPEETAVVLLDQLSAPSPDPYSINSITRGPGFSMVQAVGRIVGNIVSHEIGHYLGNWHTEDTDAVRCLMDASDLVSNMGGVGPDGIMGTADDEDTDFVVDDYRFVEGIASGQEHTDVRTAFALATGTGAVPFSQPPSDAQENLPSNQDWTDNDPNAVVVDNLLADGRPITSLRWWGSPLTTPVPPCSVVNGGFEGGNFVGWTATTNGLSEFYPWTVGPAGTCDPVPFHCAAPLAGTFDAMNGFDGVAGLEYELYQDVTLPVANPITLTTSHRIQFNSLGVASTLPREFEISIRDTSNAVLSLLHHEDIFLNGQGETDLGWNTQNFDVTAFAGQTVRIHFREFIPETFTGPALIEFDEIGLTCGAAAGRGTTESGTAMTAAGPEGTSPLCYGDAGLPIAATVDGHDPLKIYPPVWINQGLKTDSVPAPEAGVSSYSGLPAATAAAQAGPCGPGSGDCCVANATPGCDDVDCCNQICGSDPFCCNVEWDDVCRADALANCSVCTVGPTPTIDGWLIGFHEPLVADSSVTSPLGLYFCGAQTVGVAPGGLVPCDGQDMVRYSTTLADCCLIHSNADSRDGLFPAQPEAFNTQQCVAYDVSIQAVTGHQFIKQTGLGSLVGRWNDYSGDYADVWADGAFAYVPNFRGFGDPNSARVHILDIHDPANPTLANTFLIPPPNDLSSPQDVKVASGLLFIALEGDGNDGVAIVDVRTPPAATLVATVRVPTFEDTHNVFFDSGFLYLADGRTPRVGIVDLRTFDPDNPPPSPITSAQWILTGVGSSFVHDITVQNGRLYAAAWNSGLRIYDVSGVADTLPVLIGQTGGTATHSMWPTSDGRFVVTGEERPGGGIQVWEIVDNGGSLVLVLRDNLTLPLEAFSAHNQVVVGNRLYVSWYQAGLGVFDIDPAGGLLTAVANYDTTPLFNNDAPGGNWGVYPFGGDDRILLSDVSQGFFVVDITTPSVRCVETVTGHSAADNFWGWYSTDVQTTGGSALTGTVTMDPGGDWRYGPFSQVAPVCGSPNTAFELLTSAPSSGVQCFCNSSDDCNDFDACTQDDCSMQGCSNTPRLFGDVDGNGAVNIFDLFCVLNGFSGDFSVCPSVNVDIDPCAGNNLVDIFDLFAVLNAFSNGNPCGCPLGP